LAYLAVPSLTCAPKRCDSVAKVGPDTLLLIVIPDRMPHYACSMLFRGVEPYSCTPRRSC
jgi:hypothetical protein